MKNFNHTRKILGFALLGAVVATPLLMGSSAQADPKFDKGERKEERKERKEERKNDRLRDANDRVFTGRVRAVRSGSQFDLLANGRVYNVTASRLPRALSIGDTVRVVGRPSGDNDIRSADVRILDNRNTGNDRYNDNRDNVNTYTGTVVSMRNSREFDLRVGGQTYNVYANSDTRGLSRNDIVRVSGRRSGVNDLINARVTIVRNSSNGNSNTSFSRFDGVVTTFRNGREFDVRVDGKIYNVYADSTTPRLNRGDTVRVYGQRSGDNDIRNARVTILRNR